jgi:hypothetical protein
MTSPTTQRCTATRKDGTPCRGSARPDKTVCTFHDPDLAEQRAAGRKAGGKSHRAITLPPDTQAPPLETAPDVARLLAQVIHEVRTGKVDHRIGNTIAVLASNLLKAVQTTELDNLKAEVEEMKRRLNVADKQIHSPRAG